MFEVSSLLTQQHRLCFINMTLLIFKTENHGRLVILKVTLAFKTKPATAKLQRKMKNCWLTFNSYKPANVFTAGELLTYSYHHETPVQFEKFSEIFCLNMHIYTS